MREPTRREWTGYWSMVVQQTQNAFNDKAAQFILIPLGAAVAVSVESVAGLLIALPYVLFAPLAGWLSDRYSKRNVMVGSAMLQAVVLAGLCLALHARQMGWAMVGFFALAMQAAFFSPAKLGINKELLGSRYLGFAAGIQQMTAMLAMLIGQIAAGWLFDRRYQAAGGDAAGAWQAALGPLEWLTLLSVPAIAMAWMIPRTPALGAEPLRWATTVQHFRHLAGLWRERGLRRASLGVAYFWGFAAFINLWSVKLAKQLTGGGEGFGTLSSKFMAAASLGMACGFGVASLLLRRRIELGWVPLAGILMTLGGLGLAWADPTSTAFLVLLAAEAFVSALFLAPLNAWMQDRYPANRRGELQAAVNLQDCFAGMLAVLVIEAMVRLTALAGVAPLAGFKIQVAGVAVSCGAVSWLIVRMLPADFVRVIGLTLLRLFYRMRVSGLSTLPREGGVLLLSNHVTWADAFFLTAACPRPVRFIMEEGFMGTRAIRIFCQIFDTLPISSAKPREALRAASQALAQGDVVCLFPEGQLTRTGTLHELKRGFELIARQAKCPLVPVWLGGAWGSIFSFERGLFFRKWPYRLPHRLSVAFGPPLAPAEATPASVRVAMLEVSRIALSAAVETEAGAAEANAFQIAQTAALGRRTEIGILAGDPLPAALPGLQAYGQCYGTLFRAAPLPLRLGGEAMRQAIEAGPAPAAGAVFYDFSPQAVRPLTREGWIHCPCLAIEGVIVAMSMPDPPAPFAGSKPQAGRREGACGILLPGFAVIEDAGRLGVHGPGAGDRTLWLPVGSRLDEEGFVWLGA